MDTDKQLLNSMDADKESIKILSEYLDYSIGKDPIDPNSDIRVMFTDKTDSKTTAVIAVKPLPDLTPVSTTSDIRKLYEQVLMIEDKFADFEVSVIGFIGKKRLVFFPTLAGNRDTRLDITSDTIDIDLYKRNLSYLKNKNIAVKTSPFGFGDQIIVNSNAFRKRLSKHFLSVVSLYRKKLSEWITASDLKNNLINLVSDNAKKAVKANDLNSLVQDNSYKAVLSTVVDTITLRQLMRRFLEGYYGADSFNVNDIALGVGDGTLDDAIEKATNIAKEIGDEKKINKINQQHTAIGQLDLFESSFTDEEEQATSKVEVKYGQDIKQLSEKALKQFQLAYGGDLFAGSIGDAATKIETGLAKENGVDWVKLYTDTRAGNYSFRFEDMPPKAIEEQYEDSMSKNVQITLDKKTNKPVVFYGNSEIEQKNKGAYYTDQRFVDYMVNKTVAIEFNDRYNEIKKAIKTGNNDEIKAKLEYLLDLKIADFSSGGGSFLRGAFLKLAEKYALIRELSIPDKIKNQYSFLRDSNDAQYEWENYILNHMIYGVDIDYKAVIISSLTLTLSSLQHRPKNTKLPQLIGRTLIHQNSLINAVPYYKRKEIFGKYQKEIAKLIKLKETDFPAFIKLRDELQAKVIPEAGEVSNYASMLEIQAIELNLPEVYFNPDGTLKEHGGMDIVIGNPPWNIWNTNSDEFFSEYNSSYRKLPNKNKKQSLEKEIFQRFPEAKEKWKEESKKIKAGLNYYGDKNNYKYQTWISSNKGKNSAKKDLYKIALERFIQLAKSNALFEILVPDSFATDKGATGLRHLVIDEYNLEEYLSFENRKNIFKSIDNRQKFACLGFNGLKKKNSTFKAFFYKQNLDDLNNESIKLVYPISFLKKLEPEKYSMVESRDKLTFDLFKKIRLSYQNFGNIKPIEFSTDFNKTTASKLFINLKDASNNDIPLFEGKSINQFSITPSKIIYAIKETEINKKKTISSIYRSYRIALRDVARATDKRTLIATLLPPNVTSSNTLHVQKKSIDIDEQLFILGLFNSYTLDFVIRQLVTSHVNQQFLNQLPIPKESDLADSQNIILLVKELLKENKGYYEDLDKLVPGNKYAGKSHDELIAELNARIMIDFKLTRSEIVTLMKTFESAKHKQTVKDETQRILNRYDELTK